MAAIKVATCCYCGTKAALVLTGKVSHELSCGTCGAPLSKLKMLPKQEQAAPMQERPLSFKPAGKTCKKRELKQRVKLNKPSKFSYLGRKAISELWDVVEDIFD